MNCHNYYTSSGEHAAATSASNSNSNREPEYGHRQETSIVGRLVSGVVANQEPRLI